MENDINSERKALEDFDIDPQLYEDLGIPQPPDVVKPLDAIGPDSDSVAVGKISTAQDEQKKDISVPELDSDEKPIKQVTTPEEIKTEKTERPVVNLTSPDKRELPGIAPMNLASDGLSVLASIKPGLISDSKKEKDDVDSRQSVGDNRRGPFGKLESESDRAHAILFDPQTGAIKHRQETITDSVRIGDHTFRTTRGYV